jgi:hypothetical protein
MISCGYPNVAPGRFMPRVSGLRVRRTNVDR